MKNVLELESVMPSIGMQKPIKNAWETMIQVQNYHTSCTGMWTIFTNGQSHKICLYIVLNEEMTSFSPRKTSCKAMMKTMTKDTWHLCWVVYGITKAHSDVPFLQK